MPNPKRRTNAGGNIECTDSMTTMREAAHDPDGQAGTVATLVTGAALRERDSAVAASSLPLK